MDEQNKKLIERVTQKQQRFWMRLLMTTLVTAMACIAVVSLLVFYITRAGDRKRNEHPSPESFMAKPFIIDIPLHYEISVDMQVQPETFKKATIYCYNNEIAQTDSTPDLTGTDRIVAEGLIAVSQDYWGGKIRPGDLIFVKKLNRWFLAEDSMNARHRNSFDVFFFKQHRGDMFSTLTSDVIRWRVTK